MSHARWILLLAIGSTFAAASPSIPSSSSADALDYAFRFASAIESDADDRGASQYAVVIDRAEAGDLDRALELSAHVDGWRQGLAWADLAAYLAQAGRVDEARALVKKAEAFAASTPGWQGPRIRSHAGRARALLGDVERSSDIASDLAKNDPRQYAGRASATVAAGHAAHGEFDQALKELAVHDGETDFEVAWWRTQGYLEVAEVEGLTAGQRLQALDAARRSCDTVPGFKRIEALEAVSRRYADLGKLDPAREALGAADALAGEMGSATGARSVLLSSLARSWASLGEDERARKRLHEAETLVPAALVIDQPGMYAGVAAARSEIGDAAEAKRLYDRALAAAAALVNARPRALAVVAICRWMGKGGTALDAGRRATLEDLLGGLKDPW